MKAATAKGSGGRAALEGRVATQEERGFSPGRQKLTPGKSAAGQATAGKKRAVEERPFRAASLGKKRRGFSPGRQETQILIGITI
jgi:hypothetical protein